MEPLISVSGHSKEVLGDWDDAYLKVEAYLRSLRVQNRVLLSRLVNRILERAYARVQEDPGCRPQEVAADETDRLVSAWFRSVLQFPGKSEDRLSVQGRLGLLLAQMPEKYEAYFLADGPWPEAFVEAMKDSYLQAAPEAREAPMARQDLALGSLPKAANRAFEKLNRKPVLKTLVLWIFYGCTLVALFLLTR